MDMHTQSNSPVATQIVPVEGPVIEWGVLFEHENRISNYGHDDGAKGRAEETVAYWDQSDYPAKLVSRIVMPWISTEDTTLQATSDIRGASSIVWGVKTLRTWLFVNNLDEEIALQTGLAQQVPLIKQMRNASDDFVAHSILKLWLVEHGYDNVQGTNKALSDLRKKLSES